MTPDSSRLPARATSKIAAIADAAEQAQSLVFSTTARLKSLWEKKRLQSADADDAPGLGAEIARLEHLLPQQQERQMQRAQLMTQVRMFLAGVPASATITDAKRVKVVLRKGESLTDAVARIRAEIATAEEERNKVLRAAVPVADMKKAARAYVARHQQLANARIIASHDSFELELGGDAGSPRSLIQTILAWVDPEALVARLDAEIENLPRPRLALSAKDKAARLAEIASQLDALEREEEALLERIEDDGIMLARRPNASPAAILGVVVTKAEATTKPVTPRPRFPAKDFLGRSRAM